MEVRLAIAVADLTQSHRENAIVPPELLAGHIHVAFRRIVIEIAVRDRPHAITLKTVDSRIINL